MGHRFITSLVLTAILVITQTSGEEVKVIDVSVRDPASGYGDRLIPEDTPTEMIFFGENFDNSTLVTLTPVAGSFGDPCTDVGEDDGESVFRFKEIIGSGVGILDLVIHRPNIKYYLCVKSSSQEGGEWRHQGSLDHLTIQAGTDSFVPIWVAVVLAVILIALLVGIVFVLIACCRRSNIAGSETESLSP